MITRIPIKFLKIQHDGFHLAIKIRINKKVAHVLIDTGASKTVFDLEKITKFVKATSFDLHDRLSTGLGTSNMTSHITSIDELKIGDIVLSNYTTVLLDLSHVNQSYVQLGLKPIDGVIGSDLLSDFAAIIDFKNKDLKLKYAKKKSR